MGVIPGCHKPKDSDSYAYPLIVELLEFLAGIATFDVEQDEMFSLHAYLIAIFGDIPAISMILHMKGHNAIFPCCMCMIKGVRVPDTRNTTHSFAPTILPYWKMKMARKSPPTIQLTFLSRPTTNSLSKLAMFN